ncbi:MAG: LCP family protein [Eubacteriales bacterium]|nr:LCP family protein [Eubacteriales bacterium]
MINKAKVRRNKFFRVFLFSLAIFTVTIALGTTVYVLVAKNNLLSKVLKTPVLKNEDAKTSAKDKAFTVISLFGVDQMGSQRTEDNMLLFFNHKNQEINLISIPMDTKFNWPEDVYNEISAKRKDIPKIVPISEVPIYVSAEKRNEFSVKVLENAFHMNIDYYVNMDLNAFKYFIDLIGPVSFDVPVDMNFSDAATNVQINLEKGLQEIDGAKAIQLMQYRGYANGELGRIRTQQDFLRVVFDKLLEPKNKANLPNVLKSVHPYIQTDFENAADYMIYLEQIHADNVYMTTLPGGQTEDKKYAYNSAESKKLFEIILSSQNTQTPEQPQGSANLPETPKQPENTGAEPAKPEEQTQVIVQEVYDVKIMPIGVYNGTNIGGLAAKTKQMLEAKGYKVVKTDNYPTKPVEKTIIKAYAKEIGEELLPNFKGAMVQVDESLKGKEEEIVVVLGLTEKTN